MVILSHKLVCNITAGFFYIINILFYFHCFRESDDAEHMGKSVFYLLDFFRVIAFVVQIETARAACDHHMDITQLSVYIVCKALLEYSSVSPFKGNLADFYYIHSFHALPQCFPQYAALLVQCLNELSNLFLCCGIPYRYPDPGERDVVSDTHCCQSLGLTFLPV